ncbi:hypothetical protein DFQ01_1219 [Paenibacillus cellulosilyticus]|uniref:Uncharacterized protein n=1 Tax=Paenibacillus cellulosilyticus TaxID=375489 RepID=A0A2V2YNR3_9BACL|nr:hypothetical protein [Paenibacillus cellulosilyticus]PWV97367.1 hypothetical protein DFQ01_1219 [Paenibacillus cellulosilyticus]QKS48588.1 hypothetical protein HUB94_30630 [Paenibacillus cellulosilyticus]
MTDNKPFDEVENLVSLEALSVMAAALSQDEKEPSDNHHDHNLKNEDQLLDTPTHQHRQDDLS